MLLLSVGVCGNTMRKKANAKDWPVASLDFPGLDKVIFTGHPTTGRDIEIDDEPYFVDEPMRPFLDVASIPYRVNSAPSFTEEPTTFDELLAKIKEAIQPAVAVVKCAWCGQWGARFCECKHCGMPID